jgi:hypothetical protein
MDMTNQILDNEHEDPLLAGNNISTLLNSSTSSDSTIDHICAYTFKSPAPQLPAWSFPEFNALDAMQEGVFEDGVIDPAPRANPILGPQAAHPVDERPVLKPTPATQVGDMAGMKMPNIGDDGKDPGPSYDEIEHAWRGVDSEITQVLTDVWTAMLGWGGARLLVGKKPQVLLDSFETYYLAAPHLTVA